MSELPPECNPHPDAPHGFDRNASLNEDRYVCDCEYWIPPDGIVALIAACGWGIAWVVSL